MAFRVWRPYQFREPVDPSILRDLRKLGVRFEKKLTPRTDAILTLLGIKIDGELLDRAPNVRVVSVVAVGYDNVDVPEATRRGVLITRSPMFSKSFP